METLTLPPRVNPIVSDKSEGFDTRLPEWARRDDPIVRRHLRTFRSITPEAEPIIRIYLLQCVLIALTALWAFAYSMIIPMIVAAIFLLPVMLFFYLRSLVLIASDSSSAIATEQYNNTLEVLRVTPLSLRHIIGAKAAAAIWRQTDVIGLGMLAVALFSLPLVLLRVAELFPPSEYGSLMQVTMALGLGTAILRLLVEPFMVAAIGMLIGAVVPYRTTAILWTVSITVVYFIAINLLPLLSLSLPLWLLTEIIAPILLPVLIGFGALRLAAWVLERE